MGDTFVAQHGEEMETEPEYEIGSTTFAYQNTGEEHFTPLPVAAPRRPAKRRTTTETAYTAAGSKYPNGDLFPFKEAWRVFAGDCRNNTADEAEAARNLAVVKSGATVAVNVPLALTEMSDLQGQIRRDPAHSRRRKPTGP